MGFLTSSGARRDGQVTAVQLLSALLAFVGFSVIGGFLLAGIALPAVTVAGSAANGTAELFEELPAELANPQLPQQSNIYARDGKTLLATFYSQNRVVVPLEEISPWMQKAVVAIEDKRFWDHNGVDGEGLMRAAYVNLTSPDQPGASTLTQQLVKNTLLTDALSKPEGSEERAEAEKAATEVSLPRKIREWRLAMAFEENLNNQIGAECDGENPGVDCGKEEVLQQYLNIAQFGASRIYGVEAAAQYYFSKPAAELTAIEAATIAGITQNPGRWDPTRVHSDGADNYAAGKQRRDTVLLVMYEQEMITEEEFQEYVDIPVEDTLNVSRPKVSCAAATDAPFFCDYVTKVIRYDEVFNSDGDSGYHLLQTGGLEIVTTLDVEKQKIANEELRETLPEDDPSGMAMAMVALDVESGEILSMAQNRDFDPSAEAPNSTSINYAVNRQMGGSRGFSPGSTFKPVILAEWLNTGHSLRQYVSGAQQSYDGDEWQAACLGEGEVFNFSKPWKPGNAEGVSRGQTSVLNATALSINTAYVAMASQLDQCEIGAMAERLGFERADGSPYEPVPSSTLGTQNASPLSMASIAQTLANEGVSCEPVAILSIKRPDGSDVPVPQSDCHQAISAEVANGVSYGMQEVMKSGSGNRFPVSGHPTAGKTGTSQKNAHTWFMGYTPELVSVFWLGNPDRDVPQQNMTIGGHWARYHYGSTLAGPTWSRFMTRALDGADVVQFPEVTSAMLNGVPVRVPDLLGMSEHQARLAANEAGFLFQVSDTPAFGTEYEAGSVGAQEPGLGNKRTPGSTMTVQLASDSYPDWWYDWPSGWDRDTPPDDYWSDQWPPAEFSTNPPNGWEEQCTDGDRFNEDTGEPCPGFDEDGRPDNGDDDRGGWNGGGPGDDGRPGRGNDD